MTATLPPPIITRDMIGFGELRRLSVDWRVDISVVERAYALDWLLKGIFDEPEMRLRAILADETALARFYFKDYGPIVEADIALTATFPEPEMNTRLKAVAVLASVSSGLDIRFDQLGKVGARYEYTGPLGRRSAAQPRLLLRFLPPRSDGEPMPGMLLHPFSDKLESFARAVSLEELTARLLIAFSARPRARDIYDLWFILTRGADRLAKDKVRQHFDRINSGVGSKLEISAVYRPLVARAYDNALKSVPGRPTFEQAEAKIVHFFSLFA